MVGRQIQHEDSCGFSVQWGYAMIIWSIGCIDQAKQ